ncbi:quinohemoprotein amine dehydrogenase [Novosphingobium sp. ST904]|nr:quinohemoprotein amine dehydrogenase [Novosphingobium sp. ST904]
MSASRIHGGRAGPSDRDSVRTMTPHVTQESLSRRASAAWRGLGARRIPFAVMLLAGACTVPMVVGAQVGGEVEADKDPADWVEREAGIPVTDQLTMEKCGTCHTPDAKGNLSRISWIRATPEGWSQAIKRMVKLNGLSIEPEEARQVVKYLSTQHGLAPEEARSVMYLAERRILDETNIPNEAVRQACASCHAFAQPMSSRRSKREWALLQNMHMSLYPTAQMAYERPDPAHAGDDDGEDDKKPEKVAKIALEYLAKAAPLHTPEWAAWQPRIRTPMLGGKWAVSASLRGQGRFVGEMTIQPKPGSNEFTAVTTLRSLDTGKTFTRKGSALAYTGFSWRGTSTGGSAALARPDDMTGTLRETMWFSPDQTFAEGRWYWGEYHEFGLDVKLTRALGAPVLAAAAPEALKTGTKGAEVHLYGADLPSGLTPGEVDFGAGVTVRKVASASPNELVVTVDADADAMPGLRDVSLRGAVLQKALPVYRTIDYLKVTPETSLSHLGGIKYGKGYEQFAAQGWSSGADGKPGTADDFVVRTVDADWKLDEFRTVTYDDDVSYVGKIDNAGFFTPGEEGPNPARHFMRNNYGEVWVVATARSEKDKFGKPLAARAYLVTTVPAYKRWDQPEVSQ